MERPENAEQSHDLAVAQLTPDHWRALDLAQGLAPSASNLARLAGQVGDELARWAVTQWKLREKGRAKFAFADQMLFDAPGLEMASAEATAGVHAEAFPVASRVADLTTGIGADLIALASNHEAIGYEIDPMRARYAEHNVHVHGRRAEIKVADCLSGPWDFEYAFADPARRHSGRRTLDPSEFSPSLTDLVPRLQTLAFAWMKLTPMLNDEFLDSLSSDRAFVSHEGECKEVLVALGREKQRPGAWALVAESGEWIQGERPATETRDAPLEFVFEADPAIIRAHALGHYDAAALGDSNGYLTTSEPPKERKSFRVLWSGTFREKDIKRALAGSGRFIEVVKCRGVKLDVDKVRQQVKVVGSRPSVLLIYPVVKSLRAVIAEKLD